MNRNFVALVLYLLLALICALTAVIDRNASYAFAAVIWSWLFVCKLLKVCDRKDGPHV